MSDALWEEIRRQFSFREERVPMNAANLCPSPTVVAERVYALTRDIDRDCSSQNRRKFGDLLEASRTKVAAALGVTADEVAHRRGIHVHVDGAQSWRHASRKGSATPATHS